MNDIPASKKTTVTRFMTILQGPKAGKAEMGLESLPAGRDLTDDEVRSHKDKAREALNTLVEKYMKDDPNAKELVDRIIKEGGEGLRMVAAHDEEALNRSPKILAGLEAIVRTDGSRPSFLVVNNEFDEQSSPISDWKDQLTVDRDNLKGLVQRVGRIDIPGGSPGYAGTGFLIHQNLIITNRHVLQVCARLNADKTWKFHDGTAIDFGHELNGIPSANRRKLKDVLFVGNKKILSDSIDHAKLDLALIELEESSDFVPPIFQLSLNLSRASGGLNKHVYIIGYPGSPASFVYEPTLLDQLFQSQFGYKRLAPGIVIPSEISSEHWTIAHDATTLGGNSGSILVESGVEGLAVGLHYGGRNLNPAENWSHRLSMTLDQPDEQSQKTLGEVLAKFDIPVKEGESRRSGPASPAAASPAVVKPSESPQPRPASTPAPARRSRPDWRYGVTLEMMQRLSPKGGLEAPGDGHTPASELEDREGYDPDFIDGMSISLPRPSGDMRSLRRGGSGEELRYEHFSVIMSASRRMPIITACNIEGSKSRRLPRISQWSYDGRLDDLDQWGNELYQGNDADRGHMVRREDPVWGSLAVARRANVDTFHYTNSCPQMAGVNQRIWLGLEDHILNHTREDDMRVSVFTGPYFTPNDLPYRGALIPKAFWKVVAFVADSGRFSATAYRVSQERALADLEFTFAGYKTFQISIQQVMDATGIDFSELVPFDGFSQHERVHGVPIVERLDRFEQIRV